MWFTKNYSELYQKALEEIKALKAKVENLEREKNNLSFGYGEALRVNKVQSNSLEIEIQKTKNDERERYTALLVERRLKEDQLLAQIKEIEEREQANLEIKDKLYEDLIKDSDGKHLRFATLMADHYTAQYYYTENALRHKRRPALKASAKIGELRIKTKEAIIFAKRMQYKYDYLFRLFPDLELYVEDDESISNITSVKNLEDLKQSIDPARHYLSRDEYLKLSENERNKLALDRYINSQKSKWQIGRDYELFTGYQYYKDGFDVEYFGIEKQLSDLGRDLVVRKNGETQIVQCKFWSQQKTIHEKHVAQLYGTTIQYILAHGNSNVKPVFVTNISLSPMAIEFAKYLNVTVFQNMPMGEFPRIKCNINQGENGEETRIYHLPMDQQYDTAKINKDGEFFAFTVEEAVQAGFRRAWKWSM
jgi:hypothetical protein